MTGEFAAAVIVVLVPAGLLLGGLSVIGLLVAVLASIDPEEAAENRFVKP